MFSKLFRKSPKKLSELELKLKVNNVSSLMLHFETSGNIAAEINKILSVIQLQEDLSELKRHGYDIVTTDRGLTLELSEKDSGSKLIDVSRKVKA